MKYFDLLKEICLELGISFKILSDNYVLELEYKGIRKYIYAHKFPLNDQGLSSILDDKYATYCVLKEHNIPTIEMEPIYYPYSKDYINKKFSNNEKIILKTTHGSRGNQVFKIENSEECFRKLDELFKNDLGSPVCLSPYYDIKAEYRVIVLNKKIKLIYGKKKPIIVGNGSSTILELLKEFNPHYYQKKDLKIENANKVLKAGEVLEYDFRFNLSKGANVFLDIEASVLEKLKKIALEVSKTLDLSFTSIDIVEIHNQLLILEINSGVMMDNFQALTKSGKEKVKEIYKEAMIFLFSEK